MTVRATVLLAHHVNQTSSGEMNVLGMGWSVAGPDPLGPHQVIVILEADDPQWLDVERAYTLQLVDNDGKLVEGPTDGGGTMPLRLHIRITPEGSPPELPDAQGCRGALSVGVPPVLFLEPGRYEYQLFLEGSDEPIGTAAFRIQSKQGEISSNRPSSISVSVG